MLLLDRRKTLVAMNCQRLLSSVMKRQPPPGLLTESGNPPRIDLERACTAGSRQECWLCFDLTMWNETLNPIGLNLSEAEPGKLTLSTFTEQEHWLVNFNDFPPEFPPNACATFFIVWLPRKHHCIQYLVVDRNVPSALRAMPELASAAMSGAWRRTCLRNVSWSTPSENWQELSVLAVTSTLKALDVSFGAGKNQVPEEFSHLLRRSAQHLTKLRLRLPRQQVECCFLDELASCRSLEELDVQIPHVRSVPSSVARLLESGACNLQKLTIFYSKQTTGSPKFIQALRGNQTVSDVQVIGDCSESFRAVCEALKQNTVVKRLALLARSEKDWLRVPARFLALLLRKNSALTRLTLEDFELTRDDVAMIASTYKHNTGLASLYFVGGLVHADAIQEFRVNRPTLIPRAIYLESPRIMQSPEEWEPTKTLDVFPGPDYYLQVNQPRQHDGQFLEELRSGLAKAVPVREVTLNFSHPLEPSLASKVSSTLCAAKTVTTLNLAKWDLSNVTLALPRLYTAVFGGGHSQAQPSGKWVSDLLAGNRSIARVEFDAYLNDVVPWPEVAPGLCNNFSVTSFKVGGRFRDLPDFVVSRTTTRNLSLLNDAVRFITGADVGRRCGMAFECLAALPALREQLLNATGSSESHAEDLVQKATKFLAENYFVVTGVVRRSVQCYPTGLAWQLDALDAICWRAVANKLSVSDVLLE
ncbi:hypothetical protein HPB48_001312 [Haemaphysalis longicornis]|uniref:Uncharacterized protein n=1 Tax=Haemaphysalis longicornis TaxID=44386 RepID=A0A9J6GEN9_HAELO|nr:hypothetical protein HPB48_001312 [Haemaphysalis longicornis]